MNARISGQRKAPIGAAYLTSFLISRNFGSSRTEPLLLRIAFRGTKIGKPQMWERAHMGFGGTGRKRKGACMKQSAWMRPRSPCAQNAPGRKHNAPAGSIATPKPHLGVIPLPGSHNKTCESQVWGDSRESLERYEHRFFFFSASRFMRIDSRESPRFVLRIAGPSKIRSASFNLPSICQA